MHGTQQHEHALHNHLAFVRAERARLLAYYEGDRKLLRRATKLSAKAADQALIAKLALLDLLPHAAWESMGRRTSPMARHHLTSRCRPTKGR